MRKIIKEKKGDVFQILFMLVMIMAVALVGLIALVLSTGVLNFWEDSGMLNDTAIGREVIDDLQDTAAPTTDYAIFFLFIGMNIGIVIAAVRTQFSSIVIFLFILMTFISILISAGMVNIYQGFAQQPDALEASSQLTLTNFIFSRYLPLIISVLSALYLLIMYGKGGGDIVT